MTEHENGASTAETTFRLSGPLPKVGQNNFWFHYNESGTVIIFLHGIYSDSRRCWLWPHKDERNVDHSVYWPALLKSDSRFGDPAIYLAGYYTAPDAGPYEIRNCAEEVMQALNRQGVDDEGSRPGPMTKPTMVFVCHSTGGIVARYLLEVNQAHFAAKKIGLVLIASPSYGSKWADRLGWLTNLYYQQLGIQLQWGNRSLRDLDYRFKNLVSERRLPGLYGIEAYENHFVLHRRWLPNRKFVVTEESAGRYFGAPRLLRNTDHLTCVKPDNLRHPAHELLVDFFTTNMRSHQILTKLDKASQVLYFKIKSDFKVDIVSVSDAINRIARGKEMDFEFKIGWNNEISKAIEACRNVYEQANNYLDSSSIFYNCDEKLVESTIDIVPPYIDLAESILNNAHKRIVPLIEGMSYERRIILDCKNTILNYLTHCNVYVLKTVLYPLTYILLKDTKYYYKNIVSNFDETLFSKKGFYRYVYGMGENIEEAALWYLPNKNKEYLANVKIALYVVGDKEDLDGSSGNYDFYDNTFVPQIKFQLINSEEVALYQQNRKLYLKESRSKI